MKIQLRPMIAALALALACPAMAQTVYKSVDAEGRVSYSSSPPPEAAGDLVEEVPIAPGPTEQEQQEARRRAGELEGATRRAERERQKKADKTAEAVSAAERELDDANLALDEARIQGDDDWQTIVGGGRVPRQSYIDRVQRAERRVEDAKKALRGARSGR